MARRSAQEYVGSADFPRHARQTWDPSVKSLTAFPDVLQMMSDRIDWTQQLGDAFLGQQQDVMDAVQRLRARAQATGHLNSGSQQAVVVNREGPPIIQIVPSIQK